ncbi:N-lysine methyltransferase KMT5A-A-like, partial [Ptychodera flava]|uniref:N-lysine methyltransferase KMT5A-A-like n=1 Tax=Ptychodera flava TaxID=63121 RepID=UPI00396A4BFD
MPNTITSVRRNCVRDKSGPRPATNLPPTFPAQQLDSALAVDDLRFGNQLKIEMSCKPRVMTRRQRASPEITPYDQAQSCVTRGADLPKEGRFEVRFINTVKGKGVFAVRNFKKGDYLMWYDGERLTGKEAAEREDVYDRTGDGSYMYFFKEKGKQVVIDATRTDTIARYINDEHKKPNCTVKKIADMTGTEHLCLFAIRDIHVNDEIHYNYGEGLDLPWRKVFCFIIGITQYCFL